MMRMQKEFIILILLTLSSLLLFGCSSTSNNLDLTDLIDIGSTNTYTLNGIDYEVSFKECDGENPVFSINGEEIKPSMNQQYVLLDGTEFHLLEILDSCQKVAIGLKQ